MLGFINTETIIHGINLGIGIGVGFILLATVLFLGLAIIQIYRALFH